MDLLAANRNRTRPDLPPPTPAGKLRIHLFTGHFANEQAAWHYCFHKTSTQDTALRRDLPAASIDSDFVEVCYTPILRRLSTFLTNADMRRVLDRIEAETGNTLIIIGEPAFGGLAYHLHSTDALQYYGPLVVTAEPIDQG